MPKLAGASKHTRTRKREFVAADLKVLNALLQLRNPRKPSDLNTRDASEKLLRTIQLLGEGAVEEPLTLTVMGHQVVRRPETYGLLLRTQELGEVVFSLPPAILQRLITDLMRLASSAPPLPLSY
jgi:hypothetical protein